MLTGCATHGRYGGGRTASKRVIVVGAGFAGLACAHELAAMGVDVRVFEARRRIGGRVRSFNMQLGGEFVPGRNVEGGGELIGSNHPLWITYADAFNLSLIEVTEEADADSPIVLGGRVISGEESLALYEQMEGAVGAWSRLAEPINAEEPWRSPDAVALDRQTVAQRIASLETSAMARAALAAQLAGDNAQAIERQSFLGLLAPIRAGGLDAYWTDSETHRCAGGNEQLARKLATSIRSRLSVGEPVAEISTEGRDCRVTLASGAHHDCDEVVLAVPPSVWGKIRLTAAMPASLAQGPQMGPACKHLSRAASRFWLERGISQYALRDDDITWTWDSTDNQGPGPACLAAFSGGPAADRALALDGSNRDEARTPVRDAVLYAARRCHRTRFMAHSRAGGGQGWLRVPRVGELDDDRTDPARRARAVAPLPASTRPRIRLVWRGRCNRASASPDHRRAGRYADLQSSPSSSA
ncbi:MAG: FAD-dependent oxidoreductase [Phycisphaeraceae bacterium]|nr:FAD-dependent oxidoreductase [Phycisphaeraceae bacterium]